MARLPVYDPKREAMIRSLKIYKVVFSKFSGETIIVLARNFEEATKKALGWSHVNKYGTEIDSIELYCKVDAI